MVCPRTMWNCLLTDSAGVVWAGTASGLAYRGPHGFKVPAGLPAPLASQVLGIAEDRFGWLWIATSDHVMRVNRDKLIHGGVAEGDLREYGLADGLRGVEGVKRHRSVIADPAGRIWFSLNRGISVVDPARLTRNEVPAIPHIQAISADGSPIGLGADVHIPGGHRRIIFALAGLESVVSGPGALSLLAGELRSRLERAGRHSRSRLYEPFAGPVSLSYGGEQLDWCLEQPGSGYPVPRRSAALADLVVSCPLRGDGDCLYLGALPISCAPGHPNGSMFGLKSGWRSEPVSHRSFTTLCCRAFSAPLCRSTSLRTVWRRILRPSQS